MPDSKPPAGKTKSSGGSKCGKCGRTGHNARTCGKARVTDDSDEDDDEEDETALGDGTTALNASPVTTARRPLPRESRHLSKHRPIAKPLADRIDHEPDEEDDEPEDKKPWQPAPAVVRGPACPHGNGSPASCSQCVLGAAAVKRVAIVGGNVVVDGTALRSNREQEQAARGLWGKAKTKAA